MTPDVRVVVFLDFDGVLHPRKPASSTEMFRGLAHLDEALSDFEHVGVVISSSWRLYPRDLLYATGRFPENTRRRILGSTPVLGSKVERESEISSWLERASMASSMALIVDDEPELFERLLHRLYVVDGNVGLTTDDVCRIRGALIACLES